MFKDLIRSPVLRRRTSWVVAAVLLLPFILFFHATGRSTTKGPGGTAGLIFGKAIPWEVFQQHQHWMWRRFLPQGQDVPEGMGPMLTQVTWDRLILLEHARRTRVRVDDQQLADFIHRLPDFQDHGVFRPDRYRLFLATSNMSPQLFEGLLRDDLVIDKLVGAVRSSVTVTDEEVQAAYVEAQEQLRALLFFFDPSTYKDTVTAALTEADERAWYDAHPDELRIPEQLTLEYAGRSREELATQLQLSDEDLRTFYEDHRSLFAKDNGTVPPFEDVQQDARQRATEERTRKQLNLLALDLQEGIEAQHPFEQIVQAAGLTAKTAGPYAGGSFWVLNGPPQPVLRAAEKLATGQMTDVVHTDEGVFLARLTTRTPARLPPFEEIREQVRQRLVEERARTEAKRAADSLRASLQERLAAGLRFEEAALTSVALPVTTVSFSRTEPIDPIGHEPSVNAAAFAAPLGQLTDVLEVARGFVLLRPEARIPPDVSRLSDTKETFRQQVLEHKQSARLQTWLEDARSRAKLKSFVEDAGRD